MPFSPRHELLSVAQGAPGLRAAGPGAAQALFTAEIGLHFPLWRLPSWIPSRRSLLSFVLTQSRPLVSRLRNS